MTPTEHNLFGPSSLPRIESCPGSAIIIDKARKQGKIPEESPTTNAANAGHIQHAAADAVVHYGRTNVVSEFRINEDEKAAVTLVGKQVLEVLKAYEDDWMTTEVTREERVDPWDYFKATSQDAVYDVATSGTLDLSIYVEETGHLDVADYKFGYVYVPIDSAQFVAYALGKIGQLLLKGKPVKSLRILAFQPQQHEEPLELNYSADEFPKLEQRFLKIIKAGTTDSSLIPSNDACMFCPAKQLPCAGVQREADKAFDLVPVGEASGSPQALQHISTLDLVKARNSFGIIDTWKKQVEAALIHRISMGEDGLDYKLIPKLKNRSFVDEDKADKFLAARGVKAEQRFTKKLVKPAAAEKLLKKLNITPRAWTSFNNLTERADSGEYRLVPVTNKTPGIEFKTPDEVFDSAVIEQFDDDVIDIDDLI